MNNNEWDIVRCEHCGRILSEPFQGVDPLDTIDLLDLDDGCDYCQDFNNERTEDDWGYV